MNKKQWKAVYDYCDENGYESPRELLQELKGCGVIDRSDTLDDLGEYPQDETYKGMLKWLEENV